MIPQIKISSFIKTLQLLSWGNTSIKPLKLLWYPACGSDFRVLHHSVTNNISVQSDFFIFNDLNDFEDEMLLCTLDAGFSTEEYVEIQFPDLPNVLCIYKSILFQKNDIKFIKKGLFLWGLDTHELFTKFVVAKIKIESIFIKRSAHQIFEEGLQKTMRLLNTRYFINSFYHSGINSAQYHEALNFAREKNLLLCLHSCYENIGNKNVDNLEYVFVFEKKYEKIIFTGNTFWKNGDEYIVKFNNGDEIYYARNQAEWEILYREHKPAYCFKEFEHNYSEEVYYNIFALHDDKFKYEKFEFPTSEQLDTLVDSEYIFTLGFKEGIDNIYLKGGGFSDLEYFDFKGNDMEKTVTNTIPAFYILNGEIIHIVIYYLQDFPKFKARLVVNTIIDF